ncbi:sensor histidine kinase [Microvirga massiliensis]|uniref:sensor histidine kinase n=1 Tax=Microvirga massiliensis TaxID=1033741 RepID=UPI000AC291F1|nr:HWE histidine kinase domain-containing protein [Microvirga massiliensis]
MDDTGPSWNEKRLAALRSYSILDTPPEPEFDDLVRLAARACHAPVALITLVEERRQWFKAETGLGFRETPLDHSICAQAILQPGLTVVHDLAADPRFNTNPLVTAEPRLRFYAGVVLETPSGLPLGTLCVLDYVARDLSEEEALTLTMLARQVMSQLELRRAIAERDEALATNHRVEQRQILLVRELHHRVRNTLATVQALVGATARTTKNVEAFYRAFSARLASLAKTQTLLTEDYWQTASLREMLLNELRPFVEARNQPFVLNGPSIELSADLAIPVGMALHELTANAAQFGALSVPQGRVEVIWDVIRVEGVRTLRLDWAERDGPPVEPPRQTGFGTTLMRQVLTVQCRAEVQIDYDPAGLRFRLESPLIEHRLVPPY